MTPKKIEVWLKGWDGDEQARTEDDIKASFGCRMFIDGEEIEGVISVQTKMAYDFTTILVEMIAPNFIVRTVARDEWDQEHWSALEAKNGDGKIVAAT